MGKKEQTPKTLLATISIAHTVEVVVSALDSHEVATIIHEKFKNGELKELPKQGESILQIAVTPFE